VICTKDINRGFQIEFITALGEQYIIVLLLPHHTAYILIVGSVEKQIVYIGYLYRAVNRHVLVNNG
jgi:hypothetical protein